MNLYADEAVAISPVFGEVHGKRPSPLRGRHCSLSLVILHLRFPTFWWYGSRVIVLGKATATDRTGWLGLPATDSAIDYRLPLLFTFAEGKIIRDERIFDSTGVMAPLEKVRLDAEMKTAAEMQRLLLRRTGCKSQFFEAVGDSVPCRAIGGDFFEFIDLPSGGIGGARQGSSSSAARGGAPRHAYH